MYLGLDLGTSGVKALLIDADQAIIASANGALEVSRPRHGWSEQAPADWIAASEQAVGALRKKHPRQLAAVTPAVGGAHLEITHWVGIRELAAVVRTAFDPSAVGPLAQTSRL